MNTISFWLKQLAPSPLSAALLVLVLLVLIAGAAAGLLLSANDTEAALGQVLARLGFVCALAPTPLACLLLLLAGWREKRALARAVPFAAAAALLLLNGVALALGFAFGTTPSVGAGLAFFFVLCLPVIALAGAPAVYFAWRGWSETRAALARQREQRAIEIVNTRGEASLTEIAAELGLPPAQVDDLIERLLQNQRLDGVLDHTRGRVYAAAALRARQAQMVAAIQVRGQVAFDELVADLRQPPQVLREWLYQVVQRGEFTGYVNWEEGRLYSAEAEKLRGGSCPHCGGALTLAGKGVIRCGHCGTEIFL